MIIDTKTRKILHRQLNEYLESTRMTQSERDGVIQWVKDGNTPYVGPMCILDTEGKPLDYVSAVRFIDWLKKQDIDTFNEFIIASPRIYRSFVDNL